MRPLAGPLHMVIAALAFSVMSLLVKVVGGRIPTMEIVFFRSLVMGMIAGATLVGRSALPGREPRLLLLRGLLGFVGLTCFFYAVVHLPLADATVIHYTNPVFTALIAAVVLRERLRARELVLAGLCLAGVVLVAKPAFLFGAASLDPFAVAVALTGAVFSAAVYVLVRRLRQERASVIVFYFAVVSTLGTLPFSADWVRPGTGELLALLGVGVATHVGQISLVRGLRAQTAARAMTVGYLQIVFAAAWGALVFSERPDAWALAGSTLIIVSTLLVSRRP